MGVMEIQAVEQIAELDVCQFQPLASEDGPRKAPPLRKPVKGRKWMGGKKEVSTGDQMESEDETTCFPTWPRAFHDCPE